MAWHAKETLRGLYDQPAEGAPGYLDELVESLLEPAMSPELRQLGRTLRTWRHEICAWHQAQVSNGPTEATNNLIKVIKRIGFGFRRFRNYRLRVLLYAGRPNWDLLATLNPISPPEIRRAAYLGMPDAVILGRVGPETASRSRRSGEVPTSVAAEQ